LLLLLCYYIQVSPSLRLWSGKGLDAALYRDGSTVVWWRSPWLYI